MGEYYDADDFETMTEEEWEEAQSAAEAIIAAEFDSLRNCQAWEAMQDAQEGDGFLSLT